MIVSKLTNDKIDIEREGQIYVYVWILSDKHKAAEY